MSNLNPPGGQIGTSFEIALTGTDLDDARQLFFADTNITATVTSNQSSEHNSVKFLVTISTNVLPGIYDVRVAGRFGITNPRAFAVGAFPERVQPAKKNSNDQPVALALNTTVNSHLEPLGIEIFKTELKKKQRVFVQVLGRDIDSRIEPVLMLCDSDGRELEISRGTGRLDFTPPTDGAYLLKIHDVQYQGGGDFFYRLSISTAPHIDFIFPPSGTPGTRSQFAVYGRNLPGSVPADGYILDGKILERRDVEIELTARESNRMETLVYGMAKPSAAVLQGMSYRFRDTNGISNPIVITFANEPVVIEQEPNNGPNQAQPVSIPCEYVGRFYPAADRDWLTFAAKKDSIYWIELISERLGLTTDPFLLVQRLQMSDKGQEKISDVQEIYGSDTNVGGVECNTSARDPVARLQVKDDGRYRIQVRDLFAANPPDPRHAYRLCIRKPDPGFILLALPQVPPQPDKDRREVRLWTTLLRRGETLPVKVLALRRDDFQGEIELEVNGLPAGVHCRQSTIGTGENSGFVLLKAIEDVGSWVGSIHIIGRAHIDGREAVSEARSSSVSWEVNDYTAERVQSRLNSAFFLGVTGQETAPISIEASEEDLGEVPVGSKVKIPMRLRHGELGGPIKVKAAGLSSLESMKELEVNSQTNQAVLEMDLAAQRIPIGKHRFYLIAQAPAKYRRLLPEEVGAAEKASVAAEQAAAEAQKRARELKDAVEKEKTSTSNGKTAVSVGGKPLPDLVANAKGAEAKAAELAATAKAAAQRLKLEDRLVTAYSEAITLSIVATPPTTAAVTKLAP